MDSDEVGMLGRSLHDAWRENANIQDPCKYPVVVAGPQVKGKLQPVNGFRGR